MITLSSNSKPFLVVSRASPNESSGTPIVIRRLLDNFENDEVIVLSRKPKGERLIENFNPKYRIVEIFAPHIKGRKVIAMVSGLFSGLRLIKKTHPKLIIGIYPDDGSLLLSYLLHRITKIPYFAYFCDLYLENKKGIWKIIAKWLQPQVFRSASKILVVNRGMHTFYLNKYAINSVLLPAAINNELPENFEIPPLNEKIIIGYSGNISRDRIQPLLELKKLLVNRDNFELRLFVPHSKDYLRNIGMMCANTTLKFCPTEDELIRELRNCNLLYLPLTFEIRDDSFDQLATCFGIKSYEYIQSCRPILVHCPSDYFTSIFFHENKAAIIVNKPEAFHLEMKINQLKDNYQELGSKLVLNALKAANQFKGDKIADLLRSQIQQTVNND